MAVMVVMTLAAVAGVLMRQAIMLLAQLRALEALVLLLL
jgi:hypothetical protein